MGQAQPPSCRSCSQSLLFLIGRNRHGNWVVQDQQGRCGGLFVSRAEALRFTRRENGGRPDAVIMVPGVLELKLGPRALPRPVTATEAPLQRVA
jgi:hypothetical protein